MAARRVLIVEDDGIIAAHLQDVLRELGYETPPPLAAGEAALAAAIAQPPDLILMDIRLAGAIDGIATARRIQDAYDIPVIYLTAHADRGQAEQAIATTPYGYLVKPVDTRELAVAVEVALHRHALDRQIRESEARYRTLTENVPGAVYRCDVEPPRRASFLSEGGARVDRLGCGGLRGGAGPVAGSGTPARSGNCRRGNCSGDRPARTLQDRVSFSPRQRQPALDP